MQDSCILCKCVMFEGKPLCPCNCHWALNRLLEMNHGDVERTKRDILTSDNPLGGSENNVIDMFKRSMAGGNEVKIGTAAGMGDPSTMSPRDLIDFEVYMGIQQQKLPNGFILDKESRDELEYAIGQCNKVDRIPMCIGYLAGYQKGFLFGKHGRYG